MARMGRMRIRMQTSEGFTDEVEGFWNRVSVVFASSGEERFGGSVVGICF
jgi:hypothetical protein